MSETILNNPASKSFERLSHDDSDDNLDDCTGSLKESSKSSSKSSDSGLADESLQNRENDHQDNRINNGTNNNVDEQSRNNRTNHNTTSHRNNRNDGNAQHVGHSTNKTNKSQNSSNLSDIPKGKERKSMFSKIIKKLGGGDRWNVGEKNMSNNNQTNQESVIQRDGVVVLKNMNYNLSYKKEKRQRRPALEVGKKLQKPIQLHDNETVQQFNEQMRMFGAKFVFVDNRIESVTLDDAKVTFVDELRDRELKKKNEWLCKNLVTYSLPLSVGNAHSSSQDDSEHSSVSSSLSSVLESLKQQPNSRNTNSSVTTIRTNKSFFGTSLIELQAGYGFEILKQLIAFIQNECRVEGIFRVGARHSKLNTLKKQIDELYNRSQKSLDMISQSKDLFIQYNSIELAGILKVFLRELPEPLIPQQYADSFLKIPQTSRTVSQQIRRLNMLIIALPTSHSTPLKMVLSLLNYCSQNVANNKMTVESLALIIAPNIFPDMESRINQSSDDKNPNNMKLNERFTHLMDHTSNAFDTICLLINLVEILFHFPLDVYKNVI